MVESKAKILAIDDEKVIRDLITDILTHYGYGITTAGDGKEALALLTKDSFDLILCDIAMPGQTGFEVFKEVQKIAPTTKFIFISAFNNQENIQKGMKLGAKAFLGKPFDTDELLDVIERTLK